MILTNDFLNKVSELLEKEPFNSEHQSLINKESKIDGTVIKADDNTILIKIVKTPNPDKQKLNEFLSKFDESQFSLLTDKFEEITGKSLDVINQCYEQGHYKEVYQLVVLVIQRIIEELSELLK